MLATYSSCVRLVSVGFHLLQSFHLLLLTSGDCASVVPDVFNDADRVTSDADFNEATVSLYDTRAAEDNVTLNRVPFRHGYAGADAGDVLVYTKTKLWAVCDDGWNLRTASVVCRSLGYRTASRHTVSSYFGQPPSGIGFSEIICMHGNETSLLECRHSVIGNHGCSSRKAAGVVCTGGSSVRRVGSIRIAEGGDSNVAVVNNRSARPRLNGSRQHPPVSSTVLRRRRTFTGTNDVYLDMVHLTRRTHSRRELQTYNLRIVNGSNPNEGRVEIQFQSGDDMWGVICSDHWTMLEARVACRQAGLGLAKNALQINVFGGETLVKLQSRIECHGDEDKLSSCRHSDEVTCPGNSMVAGVVCAVELPDLVPNFTLLQTSTYLQDLPMYYMQCALEEKCASSSAFTTKANEKDWYLFKRRLLRFSVRTWNFGTADFRPQVPKEQWQWHTCHMHYHSMQMFARYDLLDSLGNRVADGHKASFCLEDVECMPRAVQKFVCVGLGDQGISVGCADDYTHDLDCQWVDITDVGPGNYIFRVNVNPDYSVGELDYSNNIATCDLYYSGNDVKVTNCLLGRR